MKFWEIHGAVSWVTRGKNIGWILERKASDFFLMSGGILGGFPEVNSGSFP